MKKTIQFGSKRISFTLLFSKRKTLGITVTPDSEVFVKAPEKTPIEIIKAKVKDRAAWIIRHQQFFLNYHPKTPPRRYISGESHLYLGRHYRLKIIEDDQEWIKIKGKYLEVSVQDRHKVKPMVNGWYKKNAGIKIREYAEPLIRKFKKYNVEPSSVELRFMSTRWGSCTSKGKIILNPELIKAPIGCIEYVIIHELCHLVHHNHTRKFLELQNKELPDWEKWKNKLEKVMV